MDDFPRGPDPRRSNPEIDFEPRPEPRNPVARVLLFAELDGRWLTLDVDAWLDASGDVALRPADRRPMLSRYYPDDPPVDLSGTLLREWPIAKLRRHVQRKLTEWPGRLREMQAEVRRRAEQPGGHPMWAEANNPDDWAKQRRGAEAVAAQTSDPKSRKGRPPLPDDHYINVARDYVEATKRARSDSSSPHEVLADRYGVSPATIGRWVREAADRGYLTERGRGGDYHRVREPTPALWDAIEQHRHSTA